MYSTFSIKHNTFGELTSPRVEQSSTWLSASLFVGKCYSYR